MAKADYWAFAPWDRLQRMLIGTKLDEVVREDHPVRVFDLIMQKLDWSAWEAKYPHVHGRPPIHPRRLASLLLYGFTTGLRSSRDLEAACENHVDVMWLMEGVVPDHSTICNFRTGHEKELKSLYRQVCQLAATMGLVRLNHVALDGTAIRANSSRYRTLTQEKIDKRLAEIDQDIQKMMAEAAAADAKDAQVLGAKNNRVPPELADLERRKAELQQALVTLQEMDAAKKKAGSKAKSQLPETDPDSRVLPNKEGGYAPNYTAIVTADAECGFILDTIVIQGNVEAEQTLAAIDRVGETFGRPPEAVSADAHHAQGHILEAFENRPEEFYSPLASSEPQDGNPAKREDPTQPVPESQWDQLPYSGRKNPKLDKSAFLYVIAEDTYYCPQGRPLKFTTEEHSVRAEIPVTTRRYRSPDCSGCPLMSRCLDGRQPRSLRRDQYTEVRERHAQKMKTAKAQEEYKKRMPTVEPRFGLLKGKRSFRQFLLRGNAKVDTEFRWGCLGENLMKIITRWVPLRAFGKIEQQ